MRFKKIAVVNDGGDDLLDIIGAVGVFRNEAVQGRIHAAGVISGFHHWRVLHVVGRQVGEQLLYLVYGLDFGITGKVGDPAFFVVGDRSAQIFKGDLFSGNGLDDLRTRDKHVAGLFDHENPVRHGRRIYRPPGGRPHDGRYLGDNAGADGVAVENLAVAAKGIHPFLDPRAAGIVEPHHRYAGLVGHIHDLADLAGVHFPEGSGTCGEILGKGEDRAVVYVPVTRHHAVCGDVAFIHTEINTAVFDEYIEFPKRSGIKQLVEPLTGSQLALVALFGHRLFPAHFLDLFPEVFELFEFVSVAPHYSFLSCRR